MQFLPSPGFLLPADGHCFLGVIHVGVSIGESAPPPMLLFTSTKDRKFQSGAGTVAVPCTALFTVVTYNKLVERL